MVIGRGRLNFPGCCKKSEGTCFQKGRDTQLKQALQTKASIKDENVLYSQNFRGRGCCRGSRGNGHSGRGCGQEGYYEKNGQSSQQNKALKEARSKDKTAIYMLFRAIDESGFEKIAGATTSKEAWDILEKVFKETDRVKQETYKSV
jgi:gag-polypeptide of LTR copia-type